MDKPKYGTFLKYRTQTIGKTSVKANSEVEYTFVAGEDENSMVQALTVHKNGLVILVNSETAEFWSNKKPVFSKQDDTTIITFESE
ncbi:hypothetical protein BN1356_00952 [Streptococcus varani]|uniref:Uncharacterized protein n=1 Tax=Streptococcus varani TaxID=1608583 RepID=A0A0E3WEZ9_9STRE|nr:hypothetical protein [Streptococcus varani]CQR24608.1 hypothetical protein BN1356_00952 [Streptococcus varani]